MNSRCHNMTLMIGDLYHLCCCVSKLSFLWESKEIGNLTLSPALSFMVIISFSAPKTLINYYYLILYKKKQAQRSR